MNNFKRKFISIALLVITSFSYADQWPLPKSFGSASPNSKYVIRIEPSDLNTKNLSHALVYIYKDGNYKFAHKFILSNIVAPVYSLVTNNGVIITFDNWHNLGFGEVVTIYSNEGKQIRSYKLKDLYSKDDLKKIQENRTVSSIWWRCNDSKPWTHDAMIFVRDTIGGSFTFYEDGTFDYEQKYGCKWFLTNT